MVACLKSLCWAFSLIFYVGLLCDLVGGRLSMFTWLERKGRWFSACMVVDIQGKQAHQKMVHILVLRLLIGYVA